MHIPQVQGWVKNLAIIIGAPIAVYYSGAMKAGSVHDWGTFYAALPTATFESIKDMMFMAAAWLVMASPLKKKPTDIPPTQ